MQQILAMALAAAFACVGCSTAADSCEPIDTACAPQYEPTFDNIHSRTLTTSCATSGTSCHGTPTSRGGFSLADVEDAYGALSARADEDCGVLVSRLTSDSEAFQMPPGNPLSDGELCAIAQWVDAGAPR